MRLLATRIAVTFALTQLMVLMAGPVSADETVCSGTLGVVTVDNVNVPGPSTCNMDGTTVTGDVKVENGALLRVFEPTIIYGSIKADAGSVRLFGTGVTVHGDVRIKRATTSNEFYAGTIIGGDLLFEKSPGFLTVQITSIGGDLKMAKNTGGGAIGWNTIGGDLRCKNNSPAPTGVANTVNGDKEDQCAGF